MIAVQSSLRLPHFRLSRGMAVGVGVSLAMHAGVATYLAIRRFVPQPPPVLDEPLPTSTVIIEMPKPEPEQVVEPEPTPIQASPPSPTVAPREPAAPTIDVTAAPFPPSPPSPYELDGPPVLAPPAPPTPEPEVVAAPPAPPAPPVIARPQWLSQPDGRALARHYPRRAQQDGVTGRAVLDCRVTASGGLTLCAVLSETPEGAGFGEAAMKLTRYFRMTPLTSDGRPVEGGAVRIPIGFNLAE